MKNIISEGASDKVYHFTNSSNLKSMLLNDSIELNATTFTSDELEHNLSKKKQFYLSTTSTSSFDLGYQGTMETKVRLDLDGQKLMSNFKVDRVAFFSRDERRNDAKKYNVDGYDEMEDRVMTNRSTIQFSKFVKSITLKSGEIGKGVVNKLVYLADKRGIPVFDSETNARLNYEGSADISNKTPQNNDIAKINGYYRDCLGLLKAISQTKYDEYVNTIRRVLKNDDLTEFNEMVDKGDFITDSFNKVRSVVADGYVLESPELAKVKMDVVKGSTNLILLTRDSFIHNLLIKTMGEISRERGEKMVDIAKRIAELVERKNKENEENMY